MGLSPENFTFGTLAEDVVGKDSSGMSPTKDFGAGRRGIPEDNPVSVPTSVSKSDLQADQKVAGVTQGLRLDSFPSLGGLFASGEHRQALIDLFNLWSLRLLTWGRSSPLLMGGIGLWVTLAIVAHITGDGLLGVGFLATALSLVIAIPLINKRGVRASFAPLHLAADRWLRWALVLQVIGGVLQLSFSPARDALSQLSWMLPVILVGVVAIEGLAAMDVWLNESERSFLGEGTERVAVFRSGAGEATFASAANWLQIPAAQVRAGAIVRLTEGMTSYWSGVVVNGSGVVLLPTPGQLPESGEVAFLERRLQRGDYVVLGTRVIQGSLLLEVELRPRDHFRINSIRQAQEVIENVRTWYAAVLKRLVPVLTGCGVVASAAVAMWVVPNTSDPVSLLVRLVGSLALTMMLLATMLIMVESRARLRLCSILRLVARGVRISDPAIFDDFRRAERIFLDYPVPPPRSEINSIELLFIEEPTAEIRRAVAFGVVALSNMRDPLFAAVGCSLSGEVGPRSIPPLEITDEDGSVCGCQVSESLLVGTERCMIEQGLVVQPWESESKPQELRIFFAAQGEIVAALAVNSEAILSSQDVASHLVTENKKVFVVSGAEQAELDQAVANSGVERARVWAGLRAPERVAQVVKHVGSKDSGARCKTTLLITRDPEVLKILAASTSVGSVIGENSAVENSADGSTPVSRGTVPALNRFLRQIGFEQGTEIFPERLLRKSKGEQKRIVPIGLALDNLITKSSTADEWENEISTNKAENPEEHEGTVPGVVEEPHHLIQGIQAPALAVSSPALAVSSLRDVSWLCSSIQLETQSRRLIELLLMSSLFLGALGLSYGVSPFAICVMFIFFAVFLWVGVIVLNGCRGNSMSFLDQRSQQMSHRLLGSRKNSWLFFVFINPYHSRISS